MEDEDKLFISKYKRVYVKGFEIPFKEMVILVFKIHLAIYPTALFMFVLYLILDWIVN